MTFWTNILFFATRDLLHEVDPFKDAERDEDYWARIDEGFDWLRKHHHDGEKILLVSHSITIRSIVDRYAPELRSAKTVQKRFRHKTFRFG